MTETKCVEFTTGELDGISVSGYRETPFFSTVEGQLCQWIELDLSCAEGWRKFLSIEIRSGGKTARRRVALRQGEYTLRGYAPALWPAPPDAEAKLVLASGSETTHGRLTIGSHRPWTMYLLSDCCADDSWAYGDLNEHDRDDYRTTLAELAASADNCYNYPSVYQIARYCRYATPEEKDALRDAFASGRFYLSPVPCQLLCGAFTLAAYPLLLEPYRYWRGELGLDTPIEPGLDVGIETQVAAYHMEAPTWSNGLVNLFSCAGFRLFGKSLLRYLAPWIDELETLPVVTRLEVAPGRHIYLVLSPNSYSVGYPLLAGQPQSSRALEREILPPYVERGDSYPTSAIPIVGLYSDLCPELPDYVPAKLTAVEEVNACAWDYPRLVNATWEHLAAHVERELGKPDGPVPPGLRTVRGDTGSSWEAWMSAAQAEMARFRVAQRDVVSLRTLEAMLGGGSAVGRTLRGAVLEVVELGDHAWNGSSEASKQLNLAIRRDRLARVEASVSAVRSALFKGDVHDGPPRIGVVNTLGWARTCRVHLPGFWASGGRAVNNPAYLEDPETGEAFAIHREGSASYVYVPLVPAFGYREFELRPGVVTDQDRLSPGEWPLAPQRMRPLLIVGEREWEAQGKWGQEATGRWEIGPFTVVAQALPSMIDEGMELSLTVEGAPPAEPYELRWLFDLPWKEAIWRGESGGGFVTPGPPDHGGDSLLGITGSIYSCGEGLSAMDPSGSSSIDFAFDQTGMCGLGGRSTQAAQGTYNERVGPETAALSVWSSTRTPGRLELYLLGTAQNHREALLDQGGARRWQVRCGLRRRAGAFDDAALYRYSCGFSYPGEIVEPEMWKHGERWLNVSGDDAIIALGAHWAGERTYVDLYNTLREPASFALSGPATEGRSVRCADMLGRILGECPDGRGTIDPLAYLRVVVGLLEKRE
jgi:hypothetical protein